MLQTLWCRGLGGSSEQVANPPVEAVIAHMRADYDTWGWADPMVELSCYEHPVPCPRPFPSGRHVSQLLIFRHPSRGFFFEYSDNTGRALTGWMVAIDPAGSRDEWVSHMAHGEDTFFLAACFLPLAASEQAVSDYMTTKQRSSAVQWVPFWELDPRRDEMPRSEQSPDAEPGAAADTAAR